MAWVLALMSCALLAVMPTTASDYALSIFGNANMDDTIDEGDIEYARGIIEGTNKETELSDADYDGDVDEDDIAQIELIMRGEEKELTLIDMAGRIVTIPRPIERVVSTSLGTTRIIIALDGCDRLKGSEIDSSGNGDWAGASCVGEHQFACGGSIKEVVDVG
ncbi:MAG TPA: hypothetical protein PKK92_02680, partial [Methanothrix sp.]|nr:hypothetical protein [Methanothrix sp.]